jgi:hypothetical protein
MTMIAGVVNLVWLAAIVGFGLAGWTNGLLTLIAITLLDIALDLKGVRGHLRDEAAKLDLACAEWGGEHPVGLHVDNSRMAQIFTPTWPAKES